LVVIESGHGSFLVISNPHPSLKGRGLKAGDEDRVDALSYQRGFCTGK